MILYDFKCQECESTFERLESMDTRTVKCNCGGDASRLVSAVRSKLEGLTGSFPSAAMRFARQHEEAGRKVVEE